MTTKDLATSLLRSAYACRKGERFGVDFIAAGIDLGATSGDAVLATELLESSGLVECRWLQRVACRGHLTPKAIGLLEDGQPPFGAVTAGGPSNSIVITNSAGINLNFGHVEGSQSASASASAGSNSSREQAVIEHDRMQFSKTVSVLGESMLLDVLRRLGGDHSYLRGHMRQVREYAHVLNLPENEYLTPEIAREAASLASALNDMLAFVALNFFVFPKAARGDDTQSCLQPELNDDRASGRVPTNSDRARYDELSTTLNEKIQSVQESYSEYRRSVKRALIL